MILIVTAMPEELRPIRARLRPRRPRRSATADDVVVAATGDGRLRAESGLRELLERHRPAAWIGAGLAGAATPGVPAGTLLVARNVSDPAWAGRVLARGGARAAIAVTLDRIAASPKEKAAFASFDGAGRDGSVVALDLESAGWASAAGSLTPPVPGLVVRIVSDAADEEIPGFVARASSPAGVDRGRIALHALAHPSAVGKLLAMRRRARSCAERLASFLGELADRGFDRS